MKRVDWELAVFAWLFVSLGMYAAMTLLQHPFSNRFWNFGVALVVGGLAAARLVYEDMGR